MYILQNKCLHLHMPHRVAQTGIYRRKKSGSSVAAQFWSPKDTAKQLKTLSHSVSCLTINTHVHPVGKQASSNAGQGSKQRVQAIGPPRKMCTCVTAPKNQMRKLVVMKPVAQRAVPSFYYMGSSIARSLAQVFFDVACMHKKTLM